MKIGDNVKKGLAAAFVLLVVMVAGVALFMTSCQEASADAVYYEVDAADPSMFGDYEETANGPGLMKFICRIATPNDAEFIYAPSESLFKATNDLQLWGCPNADRVTFQNARAKFEGRPVTLPAAEVQ